MPGRRIATVLMLDVVGSTHVAAELGDALYRELSSPFGAEIRALALDDETDTLWVDVA